MSAIANSIHFSLASITWCGILSALAIAVLSEVSVSQSITPTPDGTGSLITQTDNRYDITGGQFSSDGINLFHSFDRFGLNPGEMANFLANPTIRNILGRVTGGTPSIVEGLIQVTGSHANLYLMNPAGIVFGQNASLNVPAAFTATTANAISFGNQWFNAIGTNHYTTLVGDPTAFAFTMSQPGSIINAGSLALPPGQHLTLLGGTVLNTGTLLAPGGQITVAAVPGQQLVRVSQSGSLLSYEFQPISPTTTNLPTAIVSHIPSMAQLITGGQVSHATGAIVNPDGSVQLTGAGLSVIAGDVVSSQQAVISAHQANLMAANSLTLVTSHIQTTSDLRLSAANTVRVRDSVAQPVSIQAGGHLTIQGNQGIDLLALNHLPQVAVQSGGDLRLISDGNISTDAHFQAGGDFTIVSLAGTPANFLSLSDPLITVGGDYSVGNYTGASLQVNSGGNITYGSVVINNIDPAIDPNQPAFILNAAGDITGIGNVSTTFPTGNLRVNFQAGGSITAQGMITASPFGGNGGSIALQAGANITTGDLISGSLSGTGGEINLQASNNITTGNLISSSLNGAGGGITLTSSNGTIRPTGAIVFGSASGNQGGALVVNAPSIDLNQTQGFDNNGADTIIGNVIPPSRLDLEVAGSFSTEGGSITATVIGDISITGDANALRTEGGDITFQSSGRISFAGIGSLRTAGGNITLSATQIDAPDVEFNSSQTQGNGGNVTLQARDRLTVGTINSSSQSGNGGNVTLDPRGDIQVQWINAQGGSSASGGNVDITTDRLFRALGSFTDQNGVTASISTAAGTGGAIMIRHGGGFNNTPFIVGNATINGTQGALTTGTSNTILPSRSFPGSYFQGSSPNDIQIITFDPAIPQPICLVSGCDAVPIADLLAPDSQPKTPVTLELMRSGLREVETMTGIKPAIIYVQFTPTPAAQSNVEALEANRTQEFHHYLQRQIVQGLGLAIVTEPRDNDQLELLLVTANGEPVRQRIPSTTRVGVLQRANNLRMAISDPRQPDRANYLPDAQQLYQWMVAPLLTDLAARGIQNLVFILDAGLRTIPLAALHDGNQFLIEQYSVGLMPSFSLTDTRYVDVRSLRVLAAGASIFQGSDLAPLPAVPLEVATIAERLWQGKVLLNSNFTLPNLQAERQRQPFGIIHLATHGEFLPGDPSQSFIQLWDSKLQLEQIRQLGWSTPPVELAVLSACNTAFGDETAELGFAGVAAQTGVKSAIASLWYVSDVGTLGLMTEFYQQLKTAPIRAEALRQAQLALLQGKTSFQAGKLVWSKGQLELSGELAQLSDLSFQHPYYWSGFTMIGSPW